MSIELSQMFTPSTEELEHDSDTVRVTYNPDGRDNYIKLEGSGTIKQALKIVDGTIEIDGDIIVEDSCPIRAGGTIAICGKGTLTLRNTGSRQPCIGSYTCDGMSFGRWEYSGQSNLELIVDGVQVICESPVANFTLGAYGEEVCPKIKYSNGGFLAAPEAQGERVLIEPFTKPSGSTKISDDPIYAVVQLGEEIPFSEKYLNVEASILAIAELHFSTNVWRAKHLSANQLRSVLVAAKKGMSPKLLEFVDAEWSADQITYAASSLLVGVPQETVEKWHEELAHTTGGLAEICWFSCKLDWYCEVKLIGDFTGYCAQLDLESGEVEKCQFLKDYFKHHVADTEAKISQLSQSTKQVWWELIDPWAFHQWENLDTDLCKYYLEEK